jgi:hypothetical protein
MRGCGCCDEALLFACEQIVKLLHKLLENERVFFLGNALAETVFLASWR